MGRRFVLRSDDEAAASPELSIAYREELNEQQYEAATAPGGATLIVAGAGTGKTRTLLYRLAYLVETGTPPEQIVLLTFTRRASSEMLARASDLLDGRCRRVQGGTFHSFCLGILRRHAPRLGFSNTFTILDAADAADVINVLRTAGGYAEGEERFPKKRTLQNLFSAATNTGADLPEVLAARYPQYEMHLEVLEQLRREYAEYKRAHDLMDFDDLLVHTLRLFEEHPAVRKEVAARCRHVLVDEYQDTNQLQAALVRAFASVHGNVTAVGDDAQSIYRFRGADFRNIFAFPDQFEDTRICKLEHNYRSTQPILDLANRVIAEANRSYDKELFTDRKEGEKPAWVPAPDDRTESRFVAQAILQLREEGVPLRRMAVLFRSGFNSYDLEVELNRRNIPFVKYGGLKLSDAAHIKDVLAHLKVIENPMDAVAWNRILQLIRGIGPKTAHDLIEWITSDDNETPFELDERGHSARYIDGLKQLFQTLRPLRHEEQTLAEEVEAIVRYYDPVLEDRYYDDFPKRRPDLDRFVELAGSFTDRTEFLASLALDPVEMTQLEAEGEDEDEPPLVLSTIHSAKGLEFHSVFLIQALDGVLPSSYALKEDGGLDEERRLLYVALTRAEENLFVSYPMVRYRRSYGDYLSEPTRFLEGMPEEVLETMQLVEERRTEKPEPETEPVGGSDGAGTERAEPTESGRPPASEDGLPF